MLGEVFKQSNISPNISANKFYKCWERCSNDPTFHPTFHPTFLLGYDLNTLWRSCAFETWNHDQNANGARFFKGERMRNANNVVWGVQMAQHFTQDLKTMKLLATVTQHFWLKSTSPNIGNVNVGNPTWCSNDPIFHQYQCWVKCWIV